jgi:NAD(P)-dependent dehydrogenase (short-subunit alcohol dehydrogenase family)
LRGAIRWHYLTCVEFANRHALVTGGTSGIGLAISRALVERGCHVVATGLHAGEIQNFPLRTDQARALQLDVTNPDAITALVSTLNRLDLLVNCAGTILRDGREHEPEGFSQVVDVNLNGTMRVCHACKPLLVASKGSVVNVASIYSVFGAKHAPAYSASKGGVVQLTKSLAIAWAAEGVRVNAVLPGWIETPFTEPVRANPDRNRAILERTPLGRWGKAEEVAPAVLFLASNEARFITGAVLAVDGGYSAS